MGTLFLERKFSPLDILVRNFFQADQEEFTTPNNRIINHPIDRDWETFLINNSKIYCC